MSLRPDKVLEWADGEFNFALYAEQIEELQKVCGTLNEKGYRVPVGFGLIYQRAVLGAWFVEDIKEVIRLGFIGGGMDAVNAKRKTETYTRFALGTKMTRENLADVRKPDSPELLALCILHGAMHGFEDLPPGEAKTPKA